MASESVVRVATGDSITLAVESSGAGTPLVFAHGLSSNRQHTLRSLAPLLDRFRLVAFDQRGHGNSTPVTDPALYDPERMADDIGAVMDAGGISRAVVGGESMGAATALLFALRHPERVERLLLVAPAFGPEPLADRQRLIGLGDEIADAGFEGFLRNSAARLRDIFGAPPDVVAYIGAMHRTHAPASLAAAFRSVPNWVLSARPFEPPGVPVPLEVVAWENDPTHPLELARRVVAARSGARLRLLGSPLQVFADPPAVGRAFRER